VKVYQAVSPPVFQWRLRKETGSLFHSPNYFLPPFQGPSVATIHDLSHVCLPQFHPAARVDHLNRALPATFRQADYLITDAESVRQEIISHFGWPADRIAAVPLGVAPVFHPRNLLDLAPVMQSYGLKAGAYTLFVGTIEPRKNLERLLSAYEALPATVRQRWPLVLAGARGWQSDVIHDRMSRAAASGWLRYLEFVPQKHLPFLYAGARLFAYPSLYEGFGLPPLEAMASGVPVVTSKISSLPEVVGNAALTVDPHDVFAMSAALALGLEDESWRAKAVSMGLERASLLTWDACVKNTVAIYSKVLKQRG
jgi:alpha-1,3-rhamnosyl/mannosyltransferase